MRRHVLGDLLGAGCPRLPALARVALKLQMREMRPTAARACACCRAWCATLPAMPRLLQWMCTGCGRPRALAASVSVSRIARGVTFGSPTGSSSDVDLAHVALPQLHTARIDDLDRVALRRAQQPRHIVARALVLPVGDLALQVRVVAHQDETAGIDDRRIVELRVRVPRAHRRRRRHRRLSCTQVQRSGTRS